MNAMNAMCICEEFKNNLQKTNSSSEIEDCRWLIKNLNKCCYNHRKTFAKSIIEVFQDREEKRYSSYINQCIDILEKIYELR